MPMIQPCLVIPAVPSRFSHVDLLRGLSAIAVLFFHYRMFYPNGNVVGPQTFDARDMPWFELLWPLYRDGNLAVQFFWALSGFVFMASYRGQGRKIDAGRFLAWRFSRLYPLHFVTLIYLALVQWISLRTTGSFSVVPINDAYHFVLQLFLASNWGFETGYSFNAPIWSVSVEVLIYLIFFLFMRFGRTGPIALGVMFAFFGTVAQRFDTPIATCGLLFFMGAIIFRLCLWIGGYGVRIALPLAAISFAVTIALAWVLGSARAEMIVMFMCLPAGLYLVATIDLFRRPVLPRLHWIGDITYAIYLIHVPIIVTVTLLRRYSGLEYGAPEQPWFLIVYLIGVIAAGVVVHFRFEMPAQNWLRARWRHRVAARSQAGLNAPVASSSR